MSFLLKSKKIDLLQLAIELGESADLTMSKINLQELITASNSYKDDVAKNLLEGIVAKSLELEQLQKQEKEAELEKQRLEVQRLQFQAAVAPPRTDEAQNKIPFQNLLRRKMR